MAHWKYAYRRERIPDQALIEQLNRFGEDGWALIGAPREVLVGRDGDRLCWDCLLRRVTSARELGLAAFALSPLPTDRGELDQEIARLLGETPTQEAQP
jgi:hypothetical protein